jgi:hypothetical protein
MRSGQARPNRRAPPRPAALPGWYCARPAFALDRLSVLPDGRVAYRVKYPGRGSTHRVMTPLEFLARLAALVAPPRYPLLRYHGVLAPHAKWRCLVVPALPKGRRAHDHPALPANDTGTTGQHGGSAPPKAGPKPPPAQKTAPSAPIDLSAGKEPATTPAPPAPTAAGVASRASPSLPVGCSIAITDFGISVRHLDRLLGGLLVADSPRLPWAQLLRRIYATDVLACTGCGGRLRLMSAITSRSTARRILESPWAVSCAGLSTAPNARPGGALRREATHVSSQTEISTGGARCVGTVGQSRANTTSVAGVGGSCTSARRARRGGARRLDELNLAAGPVNLRAM